MKTKLLIFTIDTIADLFRDYVGLIGFPADAKPVQLMLNKSDRKIGLVIESDEFTHPMPPEQVKFDIQRVYGIGG